MTALAPAGRQIANPDVQPRQQAPAIAFRDATLERTDLIPGFTITPGAAASRQEFIVPGSGYIASLVLNVAMTSTGNSANVLAAEDAPWSTIDTLVLRDVNGELVYLQGFDLFVANLADKIYSNRFLDQSPDAAVFSPVIGGAVATGGAFTFTIRVPVILNRRDLIALLGNQDRAQAYFLRTDIAAINPAIYTTSPNGTLALTVSKIYENYSVPNAQTPNGQGQQVIPDSYGTLHFTTAVQSDQPPTGGAVVNHFLKRVGNTIRWLALIFRINGVRATVEANQPTSIRFKVGDDTIFNETYWYRRALMFERYGFAWPNGVLIYDAMHDFEAGAGNELGKDYYHTQALQNAQFQISYPAGFGSTNNSLRILTDDLAIAGAPQR